MKALIEDLIFFIIMLIFVSLVRFELYPQYREFCITVVFVMNIVYLVNVIKKIIHQRSN